MEYNIIRVNNQLCKMYYSFSVEEMNEMYSDIVDTFTEIINLKNEPAFEVCLYDYIENHILDAKLSEEKIVCVSRKNIKRLTDFKKNVPYIGVATFATLPTDYSFVLPKKVEIIEDVSVISESEKQNISLELEGLVLSNLVGNIKVGTVKITVSRP